MDNKKIDVSRLKDEASQIVFPGWKCKGEPIKDIPSMLSELKKTHPNIKFFNGLIYTTTPNFKYPSGNDNIEKNFIEHNIYLFRNTEKTTSSIAISDREQSEFETSNARINFNKIQIYNKEPGSLRVRVRVDNSHTITNIDYFYLEDDRNITITTQPFEQGYKRLENTKFSTVCFNNFKEFVGWYPNNGEVKAYIDLMANFFYLERVCDGKLTPVFGQPLPPPIPEGQNNNNTSCSNTGQFGGGGTPLKDIKLFLYANKVTKGPIKLSKPQVEVGTFATDWRPNPSDYVERHSPAYKEVKGIAIQHNQSQNKKYLEIETADGFAYGVDLWGGDAKKQLEQQQAEIEELKKLVKTLELRINV